jgi:hypothetical protein
MTQNKSPVARPARQFPVWASASIIVAALAGAAGVVYWYFTTGPAIGETVVLDRGPEDGVKTLAPDKSWRAISGNSVLRVTRGRNGDLQASFDFLHYDFLAPDQFAVLNNGRRIAMDPAVAQEIGVTDGQLTMLRQNMRRGFKIDVPEPDKQKLLSLFKDYLDASDASREARETKLLRAMDEIGDRTVAAARQTTSDAASQIKAALTPQQWQKFDQIGQ